MDQSTFVHSYYGAAVFLCFVLIVSGQFDTKTNEELCKNRERDANVTVAIIDDLDEESKKIFNIVAGKGYIVSPPKFGDGDCMKWNAEIVHIGDGADLAIYNQDKLERIAKADIVLGPQLGGVRSFVSQANCSECSAIYIMTNQVGTSMETLLEDIFIRNLVSGGNPNTSMIYSVWPSPTSFINCVVGNVLLHTSHVKNTRTKVVMLVYTQKNEDAILYTSRIENELIKRGMSVEIFDLYLFVVLSKVSFSASDIDVLVRPFQEAIFAQEKAHFVIFYMDASLDMKFYTLRLLLSKGAQLDRKGIPWLIADMETMFDPKMDAQIAKLDLMHVQLMGLRPCLFLDQLSPDEEMVCMLQQRTAGVRHESLLAGKTLFQATMAEFQTSYSEAVSFVGEVLQTTCPNGTEIITSLSDWLSCRESNTVRKVGFPRYDYIATQIIQPNGGYQVDAIYMHKEKFGKLYPHHGKTSEPNYRMVAVSDYVIFGDKPDEHVEWAVVIVQPPFVTIAEVDEDGVTYSGMCIEIYQAIVMKLVERGIFLKLKLYETDLYGSKQSSGEWSGVFGELNKHASDWKTVIGLGQISINKERLEDDRFTFSPVFGHTVLTYMSRKLTQASFMQFLRPFTSTVWTMLGFVFIASAIYFRVIQAWNPYRQELPEESNFNMEESLWHSYLVVTQIGAPFGAVHIPSRMFSVFYWFFALVVVGCYTGNLAGFLAGKSMVVPGIQELVNDKGYKFGMLTNSSSASGYVNKFLLGHQAESLRLDRTRLELVQNYDEGVQKVRDEDFILIGTSLVMKHYQSLDDDCVLSIYEDPCYYGPQIDALSFPMRSDWRLADEFTWAMRKLKESGELQIIYQKWINAENQCDGSYKDDEHTRLNWNNFIGLYILLAAGIVASYLCLVVKLSHLKLAANESKEPEEKVQSENINEVDSVTML